MDNNLSERMLREPVLGRKNYRATGGNHSSWAAELTGAMYSLIQTCIINDISPRAYLAYYFEECIKRGKTPSEDEIDSFLPNNLSPEIREKLRLNKPEGFRPTLLNLSGSCPGPDGRKQGLPIDISIALRNDR